MVSSQDPFTLLMAFNVVMAVVAFLGGWFVKQLFERIQKLEDADQRMGDKLHEMALAMPTSYVTKGEFIQMGKSIFSALRRIEDKLDGKADKS